MALDLHESDPETVWSSDLGWVPKSAPGNGRGGHFWSLSSCGVGETILCPFEYQKPGVVWKVKRYLYVTSVRHGSGKIASRTMLDVGFKRLESEPGCFVKSVVVAHVDDLLSDGKRKHLDNFIVQLEKSVLFLDDYITKYKDKVTLKSKDACVDNMLAMLGMEGCKPTSTPMVRKESTANGDEEMLEGSEAETCRSVVGILMCFKRHRFDLPYAAKTLAMANSSPT